ncbi:MAG: hypothetical protein V7L11_05485 [Nostoc sp.]
MGIGDWGLGIGDWVLGIGGVWEVLEEREAKFSSPHTPSSPQSLIPSP